MSERSFVRVQLEHLVRAVLEIAESRGASGREKRRMLRSKLLSLTGISRSLWYGAAVRVAGCLLLDLPDARQPLLLDPGPRKRRSRKPRTT